MINSIIKIPFQPIESVRNPPNTGEATGAIPLIAPMMAMAFARSCPENLSVATDREMTIPPDPAIPCNKRKVMKLSMFGEKIQNTVETIKSNMEISNSGRRPYLSLNGPKKICPIANPIILDVSPSCTIDEFVSKYPAIVGRLGKYISVTKGPKAVRAPNKINKNALELFSYIYYLLLIKNHCKITKNVLSLRRICYLC